MRGAALHPSTVRGSTLRPGKVVCSSRRQTERLVSGLPMLGAVVYTPNDCVCNEVVSLRNVHQRGGPEPVVDVRREISDQLLQLWQANHKPVVKPITKCALASSYGGQKRTRYLNALDKLGKEGLVQRDWEVKMFIKDDKYVSATSEVLGDLSRDMVGPRAIQYRDPKYNLCIGRFIKPIEHRFYRFLDGRGCRMVAKGRNSWQRAADVVKGADQYFNPVFVLADHSKFDSHVTKGMLEAEHEFYSRFLGCRQDRRALAWLLSKQFLNKGRTKNGTKYSTPNTRMSGDFNTGSGNTAINIGLLRCWAGPHSFMYVDGDDSITIMERKHYDALPELSAWMLDRGMETKYTVVTSLYDVDFCQSKIIEVDGVPRFVREPLRVLTRAAFTPKNYPKPARARLVTSMGYCELAMNYGVPILQELAVRYKTIGKSGKLIQDYELYRAARLEGDIMTFKERPISAATRESFARVFGIEPREQVLVEAAIRKVTLADTSDADVIRYVEDVRYAGSCEDVKPPTSERRAAKIGITA